METVRLILLFFHFLGLSALLGGIAVQLRAASRRVDTLMVHGVLTQLGTGVLLVAVREIDDLPVNSAKYAVKLGIAAVIAVPVLVGRRRALLPASRYAAIALLSVANVAVAVFWT